MLTILASTGRVLLRHWPALLAWLLGGTLARYLLIDLAGFVGGYSSTAGLMILPLAILARLVSIVGMFLVMRDGLRNLQTIAPVSVPATERRAAFVGALLSSILPFFAVYAAGGGVQEDIVDYSARALEVNSGELLNSVLTGIDVSEREVATELSFTPWTIAIIAMAFAGRWAWKRWSATLPRALSLVAVYLEVVWVFFSVLLLSQAIDAVTDWVDARIAMVWLHDLRDWVSDQLLLVSWIWDGVEWLLGQAGGILLQPLAWLTIAGVIYGQAVVAERLRIENRILERARERSAQIPVAVRRRLREVGTQLGSRFTPIWRAIVLMWRAGPVLIAAYALLYTVLQFVESVVHVAITRVIGPQEISSFWMVADAVIFLAVPLLIEPIRIALIAGTYDSTIGVLRTSVAGQGSTEKRTNIDPLLAAETSTQNGPSASAGTMKGSSSSYGPVSSPSQDVGSAESQGSPSS